MSVIKIFFSEKKIFGVNSKQLLPLQLSFNNIYISFKWHIFIIHYLINKECYIEVNLKNSHLCESERVSHSVLSHSLRPHGIYTLPGSTVHETLQTRILEWVAISLSRGSSWPRNQWVSTAGKFSTHLYSWPQTQKDSIEHVHFESKFLTVWNHLNSPGAEFLHFSISVLNIHWKDWCWSWNSGTLATWWEELTHWKRPWCWERWKAGGEGDEGRWDGWMASPLDGLESEQALGVGDE